MGNEIMPVPESHPSAAPLPEAVEAAIMTGDYSRLSVPHRLALVRHWCEAAGVEWATGPVQFITAQGGKLIPYCTRGFTDQLRSRRHLSTEIMSRETVNGIALVRARVSSPDGRHEESIGAVTVENLKGDALCNALMKCETKAKRRATLSLCGIGWADESEIETIPRGGPLPPSPGLAARASAAKANLTPAPSASYTAKALSAYAESGEAGPIPTDVPPPGLPSSAAKAALAPPPQASVAGKPPPDGGEWSISAPEAQGSTPTPAPPQIASQALPASAAGKCKLDHLLGVAEAACLEGGVPRPVLERKWLEFQGKENGEALASAWIDAITPRESRTATPATTPPASNQVPAGQEILVGTVDKVWPNENQGQVAFVLAAPTDKPVRKYKGKPQIPCYMSLVQEEQDIWHADLSAAATATVPVSVRGEWRTSKAGKLSFTVHEVTIPATE